MAITNLQNSIGDLKSQGSSLLSGNDLLSGLGQRVQEANDLLALQDAQRGGSGSSQAVERLSPQDVANSVAQMSGQPQAGMCHSMVC